jgi:O-antigen ligase
MNIIDFAYYIIFLDGTYGSFFVARNAAGGFLSIIVALSLVYFMKNKSIVNIAILILNSIFLIFTYSRGSIFGLFAGLVYFWLYIHKKNFLQVFGISIILIIQTVLIYKFYPLYQEATSYNEISDEKMDTKEANIYIRLLDNWPSGVDCFLHSPLLGTGLGSLNDKPYEFKEVIPYILSVNSQKELTYNSAHAHHSYLHFLGELGFFGFLIFMLFWINLLKYIDANIYENHLKAFFIIVFFNITFASFTEHRIVTPATILPFTLMLGLYIVSNNYTRRKNEKSIST